VERKEPLWQTAIELFIIVLGLAALIPLSPVHAEAPAQKLFRCAIGKKSVSVTMEGDKVLYHFGTPAKDEITIVGSAASGNVFEMAQRYAGWEYQLRFTKDNFSYIVYSTEANEQAGAAAISGLMVMQGTKKILDKSCSPQAYVTLPPDSLKVPQDSETYSAM
jgi:hypothetical protein